MLQRHTVRNGNHEIPRHEVRLRMIRISGAGTGHPLTGTKLSCLAPNFLNHARRRIAERRQGIQFVAHFSVRRGKTLLLYRR